MYLIIDSSLVRSDRYKGMGLINKQALPSSEALLSFLPETVSFHTLNALY